MTEEQQAIEGLMTHPGWLLFRQHCRQEWGASAYGRRLKAAMSVEDPAKAVFLAKVIDAANDEINALLTWPEQRLRVLAEGVAREQAEPSISRRGPNL